MRMLVLGGRLPLVGALYFFGLSLTWVNPSSVELSSYVVSSVGDTTSEKRFSIYTSGVTTRAVGLLGGVADLVFFESGAVSLGDSGGDFREATMAGDFWEISAVVPGVTISIVG